MDLSEEDLIATKLDNGSLSVYQLIDYWYMKYGIPKFEIDFAKEYIERLEVKNEQ